MQQLELLFFLHYLSHLIVTQAVPGNFSRGLPHDFVPLKGEIVKMELLSQVGQTT